MANLGAKWAISTPEVRQKYARSTLPEVRQKYAEVRGSTRKYAGSTPEVRRSARKYAEVRRKLAYFWIWDQKFNSIWIWDQKTIITKAAISKKVVSVKKNFKNIESNGPFVDDTASTFCNTSYNFFGHYLF